MLVVGRNGLGQVDVLAHHGNKLDAHALELEIPRAKPILAQVVVLNVLKQAVVLLGGNLPLLPAGSKRVVLGLHDGRAVENVVRVALDRQPPVLLVVRGIPLAHFEIVAALPRGQHGGAPVQLFAGLGSGIRLVQLGEIGLDGAEVPVYPADQGLVDDVGGDDEEFGVLGAGRDHGGDGRVFDVYLVAYVSSMALHCVGSAFRLFGGSYNIVVHLDVQDIVLDAVVRRGKAALGHVNLPLLVGGLARKQFLEKLEIVCIGRALEEDDAVEDAAVLGQVALSVAIESARPEF